MIRMLVIGYVFAIRSERALRREVQVNLAYRWFCGLTIEDKIPDHSAFSRARNERFRDGDFFRRVFERVVSACIAAGLVGGQGFSVDASLIAADANKCRSTPGAEWNKEIDPAVTARAVKEYLATLDDSAFGAASDAEPKFVSPSDPAAQWTFIGAIDAILAADKLAPPKQRHTAKRIFQRLKAEHGYAGGYTTVKSYVHEQKLSARETFVPLAHPPGHAQVDFSEAIGVIGGVRQKLHIFFMDLPHSDAPFTKVYPAETTEAFLDGHVSAFAFFGRVPESILYDQHQVGRRQDLRRRHPCSHADVHGIAQPFPVCRPVRTPWQRQRQGQGREPGQVRPTRVPDAGAGHGQL